MTTSQSNEDGDTWSNRVGEGVGVREKDTRAEEESLRRAKTQMTSLADFCIYAQFDSPFAKLSNLSKSIAKPLESNFWAFF